MNPLEDIWNDYPTAGAPIDAVIAQARGRARRRRRAVVGTVAFAAAAALVVAVVGVRPETPTPAEDLRPVAFQADVEPAADCPDLLADYHDRALANLSAGGWRSGWFEDIPSLQLGPLLYAYAARTADAGSGPTGTNVQEALVDEPDVAKTDGTRLVRLRGSDLMIDDVSGAAPVALSALHLPRIVNPELLLAGDHVVVIGTDGSTSRARAVTVSIADPRAPRIDKVRVYSSRLVAARQDGTTIRLVLAEPLPDLGFVWAGDGLTRREALSANRRAVRATTLADWMPTVDTGGGPQPLLDCTQVGVPKVAGGVGTVSIVGFAADDSAESAVAVVGSAETAYASADHVVLADSVTTGAAPRTRLYDFAVDGVNAVHVASGEVAGRVADRWSIDEHASVLRVAVGSVGKRQRENGIVTLRQVGDRLVRLGRVRGLGPDEQIKSVRWFDDLAVVVTYREIDPLFTIDLADQARPRVLGALSVPGFSSYLHPIGHNQLMGLGYADGSEVDGQIAVFDISDLADVRQTDVVTQRHQTMLVAQDPRSFTWLPGRRTALTVVQRSRTEVSLAEVVVSRTGNLRTTLIPVKGSGVASRVRTLPLPDGRVVISTDQNVSFLSNP